MSQHRERRDEAVRETHDQITAVRHAHPDWPICVCGWPIDPAALIGGYSTHPNCEGVAAQGMSVADGRIGAPAGERANAQAGRLDPVNVERSPA